jgi:hypothetical protein
MIFMKVALLSCAFYLAFVLVLELAFFAVMLWKDNVGRLLQLVGMDDMVWGLLASFDKSGVSPRREWGSSKTQRQVKRQVSSVTN